MRPVVLFCFFLIETTFVLLKILQKMDRKILKKLEIFLQVRYKSFQKCFLFCQHRETKSQRFFFQNKKLLFTPKTVHECAETKLNNNLKRKLFFLR